MAPPADRGELDELREPGDEALSLDDLDVGGTGAAADDADDGLDVESLSDDLALDLEELDDGAFDLRDDSFDGSTASDEPTSVEEPDDSIDDVDPLDLTTQNALLDGTAAPLDSEDEMETMMDLAKAYIDMGDKDSASNALDEVVKGGSPDQVSEAETLLRKIS